MRFEDVCSRLSDEQKEQVQECKSLTDMVAFVSTLEFELTDEDLEGIVGGGNWTERNLEFFELSTA